MPARVSRRLQCPGRQKSGPGHSISDPGHFAGAPFDGRFAATDFLASDGYVGGSFNPQADPASFHIQHHEPDLGSEAVLDDDRLIAATAENKHVYLPVVQSGRSSVSLIARHPLT